MATARTVAMWAAIAAALTASPALSEGTGAADWMARSAATRAAGDIEARLTFTTSRPGEAPRRLVYVMFWKPYPAGSKYTSKAIFFSEEPATAKGFAYMGWFQTTGGEEAWLYIPELRTVRRMTQPHRHTHGHGTAETDPFDASVLRRTELEMRASALGGHQTTGTEVVSGQLAEVIDSVPTDAESPYAKVRTWVSRSDALPLLTRYLRPDGTWKEVAFTWRQVDGVWVWDRVAARDTRSGDATTLEMGDVRVNAGLPDRFFSERTMQDGLKRFRQRP
ncbi:MAG: outer membrane lipoprotein-sorting protein [Nitrospirae bacterium]|nr:outer membrane lipoprotein-sorting protein [Nitrospirota bacterium]